MIFDFDGTLADTIELVFNLYNKVAPQFKSDTVTKAEIPTLLRLGYAKAAKQKHIRWSVIPRLVLYVSREMRKHMDEVKPYPGVVDCIKELQRHGCAVGVLTSNQEGLVRKFFADNQFPDFDFVVSEKTLFGKDKALRKIIRRRGLDAEQVFYVGDEPRDVVACRRIGVKVIGVSWGLAGPDGFGSDKPDHLVSTADQLKTVIMSGGDLT